MNKTVTCCLQVSNYLAHENLFLTLNPPYMPVGSATLSRWLRDLLCLSGVDVGAFAPHSTRSASASYHKTENNLSAAQICKLADWSNSSGVYKLFYERFVIQIPARLIFNVMLPENKIYIYSFWWILGNYCKQEYSHILLILYTGIGLHFWSEMLLVAFLPFPTKNLQ